MVECGAIDQPPSFSNITIWGMVTYICMLFVGISSIYGLMGGFGTLIEILNIVGSCFGVAGLVFAILAIIKKNGAHMKIAMTCYLISCVVSAVVFVLTIIDPPKEGEEGRNLAHLIVHLLLCLFLCYLFFVQSKNFG